MERTGIHDSLRRWTDGDGFLQFGRSTNISLNVTVDATCFYEHTHALVTHATSGEKPSTWSFSRSRTFEETNIGNDAFCTPMALIFLLNQSNNALCTLLQVLMDGAYLEFPPRYCKTMV